jgi:hypothetical protein
LIVQKIQRIFKPTQSTRRPSNQQIRRFIKISNDDVECQCSVSTKNRKSGNYLVMGASTNLNQTIHASLVLVWEQQDKVSLK